MSPRPPAPSVGRPRRAGWRAPLLVVSALGALALGGCGRVQRGRECAALARGVNAELAALEARLAAGPADPAALEFAAERYDRAADVVAALPPADAKLQRARDEYRWHLVRAAGSARKHATVATDEARQKSLRDLAQEGRLGLTAADRVTVACLAP